MLTPDSSRSAADDYQLPESFHAIVLLIDDQAFVADAVRRALDQQNDIDLHYCPDPMEAISLANCLKPTVILLDLLMPQLSGLMLITMFRDNPATCETPIVVLSGREEARTKSDAFAVGANDYLVKLPDTIELRARIRYHSKAHILRLQRNEAFRSLRESQQELVRRNTEMNMVTQDFQKLMSEVTQLRGLFPICSCCKKVRNDENYWDEVRTYISRHPEMKFSESLCPECFGKAAKE